MSYSLSFVNVPTIRLEDIVPWHVGPLLVDGGLEGIQIWGAGSTSSRLNMPPNTVVQGIQVRALRWPDILVPEWYVVLHLSWTISAVCTDALSRWNTNVACLEISKAYYRILSFKISRYAAAVSL